MANLDEVEDVLGDLAKVFLFVFLCWIMNAYEFSSLILVLTWRKK